MRADLIAKLRQRAYCWRHNDDKARLSVPLGEIRAALASLSSPQEPVAWRTAPDLLLDRIAAIRDEYLKLRRDCLDQMEWHASQGDSEETGDFSTEAERHGAALHACNRILRDAENMASPTCKRPLQVGDEVAFTSTGVVITNASPVEPMTGKEMTWQKPGERAAQGTPADEQSGETCHVAPVEPVAAKAEEEGWRPGDLVHYHATLKWNGQIVSPDPDRRWVVRFANGETISCPTSLLSARSPTREGEGTP